MGISAVSSAKAADGSRSFFPPVSSSPLSSLSLSPTRESRCAERVHHSLFRKACSAAWRGESSLANGFSRGSNTERGFRYCVFFGSRLESSLKKYSLTLCDA